MEKLRFEKVSNEAEGRNQRIRNFIDDLITNDEFWQNKTSEEIRTTIQQEIKNINEEPKVKQEDIAFSEAA